MKPTHGRPRPGAETRSPCCTSNLQPERRTAKRQWRKVECRDREAGWEKEICEVTIIRFDVFVTCVIDTII